MEIKCSLQGHKHEGGSKNHWLPSGPTGRAHQPPFQSANMARKAVYSPVTTCLTCFALADAAGHYKPGPIHTSFCPSTVYAGETLKCAERNWFLWNSLCCSRLFVLSSGEKPLFYVRGHQSIIIGLGGHTLAFFWKNNETIPTTNVRVTSPRGGCGDGIAPCHMCRKDRAASHCCSAAPRALAKLFQVALDQKEVA